MKRFKAWRRRRIQQKIDQITLRLADIRERQTRLGPLEPDRQALDAEQVRLFWKRNDLYAKLAKE